MQSEIVRAKETGHSSALQAAQIAKEANVKKLIIGHFSARYIDQQPLLEEALTEFPNTILGTDGLKVVI